LGGVARRATAIQIARATAENVLVLDAGHGLLSANERPDALPGAVAAELYDRLGYDAVVLGSADLAALGPEGVARLRASAHFALLSANAYPTGAQEPAAAPYVLLDVGGKQVAILGLTDAREAPGWEIRDPLRTARTWARKLRRQADILIVLSHAGQEADRQIAARVRGIDIIVMGGNQLLEEPLRLGQDDTLLIHADRYAYEMAGRYVGVADLTFDGAGRLTDYNWERMQLDATVAEDPVTNRWLLSLDSSQPAP